MTQFYIIELKQLPNEEYEHQVYYAWDEDADLAKRKGESKFYEIISQAAISDYAIHSCILINIEGYPMLYQCYHHPTPPVTH